VKIEIDEKEKGILPGGGYINFDLLFMDTKPDDFKRFSMLLTEAIATTVSMFERTIKLNQDF
jgi:hypothetical protein